jgi:MinD superfamily P-loop ATPase
MGAVNKLLVLLKELKKPVLGVLENMSMNDSSYIKKEVEALGLPYLGKIKFDEKLEDAIGNPDAFYTTKSMKELERNLRKINL